MAGLIFVLLSVLVGAATWLFGAFATFDSFGWLGLIIGLLILGIGVVPLGIIGLFVGGELTGSLFLIAMIFVTYILRIAGGWLVEKSASNSENHN